MREVIFHAFNWKLKDLTKEVCFLQKQGFTTILISPLQTLKQKLTDWWLLYQPINFFIGNDLGTSLDLYDLCEEAHRHGLKIIVDVVLHHIATEQHNKISSLADIRLCKFYQTSFTDISDYNDIDQLEHYSLNGLPALNVNDIEVKHLAFDMLKKYKTLGVDGFRYDAFKHLDKNFREELKQFSDNSIGEVINVSNEQLENYKGICKIATNSQINTEDKDCVIWVQSHDDILNGWVNILPDDLFIKEYLYLAKTYKADVLYYAKPFDELYKKPIIREINNIITKKID